MANLDIDRAHVARTWLDTTQLSKYLGIERSTIYQYVRELRIPYHKVPGSQLLRFRRDEIDAWMATGRVETVEEYVGRTCPDERSGNGKDQKAERSGK